MTCLLQQTCGALGPCVGSLRPFFHFYFKFYWGIVHLHCCLSFRCTAKSIFCTLTYIHSFQIIFPYRSLQSSLYFTVVSYQLSFEYFIYSSMYVSVPFFQFIPPLPYPLVNISLFSTPVTLLLFCRYVHLQPFVIIYM